MKTENKPLKILKDLMFAYMQDGTGMRVSKFQYQAICEAVQILEKQEKELLEPDKSVQEVILKHIDIYQYNSGLQGKIENAMHEYANQFPPMQLLADFRIECQKYPDEPVEVLYELAKGWYNLRNFKNDPMDNPLEL